VESLPRITLVDRIETSLREAIREGRFGDQLPGLRPLARALGVHSATLAEAVARLAADGTLISPGPRRKFRVAPRVSDGPPAIQRKILFLTVESLHEMAPEALEILSRILLERRQWDVKHRSIGNPGGRHYRRRLDALLASEDAGHLVAFNGSPELAKWALARRVPTCFLGGFCGDHSVPMAGVKGTQMLGKIVTKLIALGHSRICLPVCGMPEGFAERQRREMEACLTAHGLPFVPNYHVPFVPHHDPASLADALEKLLAVRTPTAVVVFEWKEFVTVTCVLSQHGLRIPRDVSVAVLKPQQAMQWHVPRIAHFGFPVAPAAKTVIKWIEDPPEDPNTRVALPLELVEAESLAVALKD
jgi:DNA-binding LacI/PurR family transcriptional regulator/DNA-binding transcriptional regulator YhcF (GntR family)